MKIAYLFDTFPAASETFLAREVAALRQHGLAIDIWALNAGQGGLSLRQPPRVLKRLRRDEFWRLTGERLAPQLQAAGVTHIHAAWANHIADIAMAAARSANLPWSFAAHARDLWVEGGDFASKLASARFATVCTRAGEARLREFGTNVIYMAHGIELSNYPWREWTGGDEKKLLGVGRLVPKKGWEDAVQAVEILRAGNQDAHLTLVGEGPLRESLQRRAQGASVTLCGALGHEEVVAAMRAANCFVLPSRVAPDGDRDGLANVLLEAAAVGLPLVTTWAGSARDFVNDDTGWLCEPGNARELAAAVERVWADPIETRRRCRGARESVEQHFNALRNAEILLHAFKSHSSSMRG